MKANKSKIIFGIVFTAFSIVIMLVIFLLLDFRRDIYYVQKQKEYFEIVKQIENVKHLINPSIFIDKTIVKEYKDSKELKLQLHNLEKLLDSQDFNDKTYRQIKTENLILAKNIEHSLMPDSVMQKMDFQYVNHLNN